MSTFFLYTFVDTQFIETRVQNFLFQFKFDIIKFIGSIIFLNFQFVLMTSPYRESH